MPIDALQPSPADDDALVYLEVRVPRAMRDAVERHHAHLVQLDAALRQAGLPDGLVADRIDAAIGSYREALLASLRQGSSL